MRVVAYSNLRDYSRHHADAKAALLHWHAVVKSARWEAPRDVLRSFSKAKILNAARVRFEIEGGNFRLVAAFNFRSQVAYVKFIGSHAEYDRIDALTLSMF